MVTSTVATSRAKGSAAEVANLLASHITARLGPMPTLALVFASSAQPLSQLLPVLKSRLPGTLLLAASSAGELTDGKSDSGSASIFAIRGDLRVAASLTRPHETPHQMIDRTVHQLVSALPAQIEGYPHRTALLLLDSPNAELAARCHARFGVTLVAVAAGHSVGQTSEVGCDAESAAGGAAVLAVIHSREQLGIGAANGHATRHDDWPATNDASDDSPSHAARIAARRAATHGRERPIAGALVFDCSCRLSLGAGYEADQAGLATELGVPYAGLATHGQLALGAGDQGTATVVVTFPK